MHYENITTSPADVPFWRWYLICTKYLHETTFVGWK